MAKLNDPAKIAISFLTGGIVVGAIDLVVVRRYKKLTDLGKVHVGALNRIFAEAISPLSTKDTMEQTIREEAIFIESAQEVMASSLRKKWKHRK